MMKKMEKTAVTRKKPEPRAIDLIFMPDEAKVQEALRLHDSCSICKGAGGNTCYDPECECGGCGFTVFDSAHAEDIPRVRHNEKGTLVGVLASPWNIYKRG
jgi:hypothetical protein